MSQIIQKNVYSRFQLIFGCFFVISQEGDANSFAPRQMPEAFDVIPVTSFKWGGFLLEDIRYKLILCILFTISYFKVPKYNLFYMIANIHFRYFEISYNQSSKIDTVSYLKLESRSKCSGHNITWMATSDINIHACFLKNDFIHKQILFLPVNLLYELPV